MRRYQNAHRRISRILSIGLVLIVASCAHPSIARSQAALLVLLFGEDVATENFYFGLKAGANLSNISGVDGTTNRLGFNFGVTVNIKLSEKLFFIPELMPLSPKGAKNIPFRSTGNTQLDQLLQPTTSTAAQMNYIDIPLVVKYQVTEEIGVEAGPQISILTSATDVFRGRVKEDNDLAFEDDVTSRVNTIDAGGVVGLSYSLGNARHGEGIFLHARYAFGLTDIVKENPGDAVRNSVFQFAVSLPFVNPPQQE